MQLGIALLTIFASLFASSPDLCAHVYTDDTGEAYRDVSGQPLSRYCEWTGPVAPVLDAEICCILDGDDAACSLPDANGRCTLGDKMYCEYGEASSAGVSCYQPLAELCEFGYCTDELEQPGSGPLEDVLCCWPDGSCTEVKNNMHGISCSRNGGYLGWCTYGAQNLDGTVDCFDY